MYYSAVQIIPSCHSAADGSTIDTLRLYIYTMPLMVAARYPRSVFVQWRLVEIALHSQTFASYVCIAFVNNTSTQSRESRRSGCVTFAPYKGVQHDGRAARAAMRCAIGRYTRRVNTLSDRCENCVLRYISATCDVNRFDVNKIRWTHIYKNAKSARYICMYIFFFTT